MKQIFLKYFISYHKAILAMREIFLEKYSNVRVLREEEKKIKMYVSIHLFLNHWESDSKG